MQPERADMNKDLGALSGSRPADQAPAGLGGSRFDPARCSIERYDSISQRIIDVDGRVVGLILKLSNGRWIVEIGGARTGPGSHRSPRAAFLTWRNIAIAIEARQRTDPEEGLDPKGESAGPQDIAQGPSQ